MLKRLENQDQSNHSKQLEIFYTREMEIKLK